MFNNQFVKKKMPKKPQKMARPEGEWGTPFQYKLSPTFAETILKDMPKNGNKQEYLCKYINEQFDIKGYCELVIIG